jgi:hypothetical protein
MKRIMFAAIFAITAGSVFAQFTLDGYINSGLGLVITDRQVLDGTGTKNADPYITAFGVDSEQWGHRFQLNGTYTNEAGNAGAKFRIRSQDSTTPFMHYASGWVSFLNMFTLTGGIIDDGTWNSGGGILDSDMGEGVGLLLKASPIAGLDLGFGAYAVNAVNAVKPPLYNNKFTLNAAYTMPDVFKFVATFRPDSITGGKTSSTSTVYHTVTSTDENGSPSTAKVPVTTTTTGDYARESMKAIVAFQFRAVKDLTAIVEGEFDNLEKFSDDTTNPANTGKVNIFETFGYSFGDLGVGINAGELISQAKDSDMAIRIQPWVTYTIGSIVPRLDVVYFMGGNLDASWTDTAEGKYHRKAYAANYKADYTVLTIRPSVKFNVGSSFIEIGDAINIETFKDSNAFKVGTDDKDGRFTNIFYIDVKFSF